MSKLAKQSRTIRVGGFYIATGGLIAILQILDQLEPALALINMEDAPPDMAIWTGIILAVMGGIQIWLRMVTSQPIGQPTVSE